MIQVSAPGLPPWPPLWFDPEKKRAVVVVRHPIWRSMEWAFYTTELIAWIVNGLLIWLILSITSGETAFMRIMLLLAGGIPAMLVITYAFRIGLPTFLARQVFATKTTIWFSENAIGFRSRLYSQPVVIWRSWHGQPVKGRFVLRSDYYAQWYQDGTKHDRRAGKDHLREAMVLEIVLTTVSKQNTLLAEGHEHVLRSIPITEVSDRFSAKFTMVFAAAASLTRRSQKTSEEDTSLGVDIDSNEL